MIRTFMYTELILFLEETMDMFQIVFNFDILVWQWFF